MSLLALPFTAQAATTEDANKALVVDFYKMAFVDHQPAEAARRFLGQPYLQHNSRVPDGADVFAAFFTRFFAENPSASSSIKRVIAQDDLVMIHSHSQRTPAERGQVIVDIFRVEDSRIVEHWDVMQPIPETSASGRTMF